jgi:hypothetical protein
MNYIISTNLFLSVVRSKATMSLSVGSGEPASSESFSLVLRAARDTNIVLSSGQRLNEFDIHFTFLSKCRNGPELDRDLSMDDVGFLTHAQGERGEPYIHGMALLINSRIIRLLLSPGVSGTVSLTLPTVPFSESTDRPYVWEKNRPNMLRINHIEISAILGKVAQTDLTGWEDR